MISNFAYFLILGKPVIMYFGLLALLSLLTTATIGRLNFKGNFVIPFKWHPRLAMTTIIIVLFHALLGLSVYFGF